MTIGKGPVRFRDFEPPYESTRIVALANSGTVIPGSAGLEIVVEYHTQQNVGTADLTATMCAGTVEFNSNLLPNAPGQNFLAWGAPFPGREWILPPGEPFVLQFSTAGSVITNTRYWYRSTT